VMAARLLCWNAPADSFRCVGMPILPMGLSRRGMPPADSLSSSSFSSSPSSSPSSFQVTERE
jgi:hypothetical protein